MKIKALLIATAMIILTSTTTAYACPKGEHPHGGTGSHHKGGYCSYEQ